MSPTLTLTVTAGAFAAGWLITWPYRRRLRHRLTAVTEQLLHDPLTGLPNRAGLTTAHTRWVGQQQSLLLILVDLDEFKAVNDTLGHHAGDQLLIATGTVLQQLADSHGGIAARLSGDEFTLLLPIRDVDDGRVADQVLTRLAAIPAKPGMAVTASAGLHSVDRTVPLERLLHGADVALYHAKKAGGATHVPYQTGMAMPSHRGHRLRERRAEVTP